MTGNTRQPSTAQWPCCGTTFGIPALEDLRQHRVCPQYSKFLILIEIFKDKTPGMSNARHFRFSWSAPESKFISPCGIADHGTVGAHQLLLGLLHRRGFGVASTSANGVAQKAKSRCKSTAYNGFSFTGGADGRFRLYRANLMFMRVSSRFTLQGHSKSMAHSNGQVSHYCSAGFESRFDIRTSDHAAQ